ncbi:MAG: hypothetical protein IJ269_00250 [Bacteroidales bacterium]|nr:hypothetical protein [Bacteroidales bacterium]
MKALVTILMSVLMAMSAIGQNKDKKAKEFEGTIKYAISVEGVEDIDAALAMLPESMSEIFIKSANGKSVFSIMGITNLYYAKNQMILNMDLSMLGIGSFCIPTPIEEDSNEKPSWKISKKSDKKILGYKAYKVTLTDSIDYWVSKDYYLNFNVQQNGVYYLPLEFDIENNGMKIHLTAKEISLNKPKNEEVEAPKDCNYTTMEEFQEIMEEMGEGLMPEEDLDLEEDDE